LFYTNFTNNSTITTSAGADLSNSKLTGNGDYENWLTPTTYCFFESAGSINLPALTFVGGETITVNWGSHDGRLVQLYDGATLITTFQALVDVATTSTYTFPVDFTGSKTLSLSATEGTLAISQISISTAIPDASKNAVNENAKVYAYGKMIKVQGHAKELLQVIDLAGNTIFRTKVKADVQSFNLNLSGLYIVKVGETTTKVILE
jgi:hypothetical protein